MPRFVGSLKLSKGCPEVFYTAWKVYSKKLLTYLLTQALLTYLVTQLPSQHNCGKNACRKIVITFFTKQYKLQNTYIYIQREREKSVESRYQLCFLLQSFFLPLNRVAFSAIFEFILLPIQGYYIPIQTLPCLLIPNFSHIGKQIRTC